MEILERLSCNGIGKARESEDAMTVYFNRPLTDEEITFFNTCILRWARFAPIRQLSSPSQVPVKQSSDLVVRSH